MATTKCAVGLLNFYMSSVRLFTYIVSGLVKTKVKIGKFADAIR